MSQLHLKESDSIMDEEMNMRDVRDYPTVQLDTQIKVNEWLVVRKDMNVYEYERFSSTALRWQVCMEYLFTSLFLLRKY